MYVWTYDTWTGNTKCSRWQTALHPGPEAALKYLCEINKNGTIALGATRRPYECTLIGPVAYWTDMENECFTMVSDGELLDKEFAGEDKVGFRVVHVFPFVRLSYKCFSQILGSAYVADLIQEPTIKE